ncbi:MarR family winged helix-turn-helix transcriptional regulator [uncultured Leifsonia sp.]|uniref:MarR family winged helix-turn-helix transcriptional regulator n=1 Tax=uncultured Leifsonia sp. TaxID=340359 RepID=UPI0025D49A43|nr:MarR family winged helix-turn-helix transcriptional regulator [uncultured Leifsonia sp.]
MTSTTPPAAEPLGPLVKKVHLRLLELSDEALAPSGFDRREYAVLRALIPHEPLSQQALAALLGVDQTTMVAVIDSLEAKQAVTRRPDPADRRRNAIEATPAGRAAFRRAEHDFLAAERAFLAPLGDAGAERFRAALHTLLESTPAAPKGA